MKLLSHIKNDLEFNRNLYNLVDALGKIAVSQYYLLEKKNKLFSTIVSCVNEIFALADGSESESAFLNARQRQAGVIAVTSDSGLLGGLNMQVMNLAAKEVAERQGRLIVIGDKGRIYAVDNGLAAAFFGGISDEARFSQAQQVRDYIVQEVSALRLGALKIIYPHPISVIAQRVQVIDLLPLSIPKDTAHAAPDAIRESSLDRCVDYLAYLLLGNRFYEIFGLSRLAELSARFIHLENSKTKLEELNKQLKLQYFRQKHELTDRNMRELFAARLTFKG